MEKFDIFQDIAERTGGSIYIGVVGPVRTGKSTFIKRFMDLMVMPHIADPRVRERTQDQLPQSAAGRTIMTTQPRFVPDEPVEIVVQEPLRVRVRLVDCVGYGVEGAKGFEEDGQPRMVRTPWSDREIPFEEAAEIGTQKVIADHSTIGLVVATDGSITDIPRENYVAAEERVVQELTQLQKPFLVLLNSTHPQDPRTQALAQELEERYRVTVIPVDCLNMTADQVLSILHEILFEFPVREVAVRFPQWVDALDRTHWLRQKLEEGTREALARVAKVRDVDRALGDFGGHEFVESVRLTAMDLGTGSALVDIGTSRQLFFQVLQEMTGYQVQGDHHLLALMRDLSKVRAEYDQIADALRQVRATGYGVVAPQLSEITFQEPELIRQGNRFGVRLRATAPSIHMVRADITTEVTPFVGTEKQGEEFARYLTEQFEKDPASLWDSDFLGRPLQDLVREGLQSKLHRMPENAQHKLQETLTKIVNEGSGGLICIIL